MVSRKIQCLAFLCFVLVWDFTAVRLRERKSDSKPNTVSQCRALPIAMRHRQVALDHILFPNLVCDCVHSFAQLVPATIFSRLEKAHPIDTGGAVLLYSLISLQC